MIAILNQINEVLDKGNHHCDHDNKIPIMCNYVVSKLSLIIESTRLDIVVQDILAHVVFLNLIKQMIS